MVGHALDPLALSQSAAKLKAAAGAGKALQYRKMPPAGMQQCSHRHHTGIIEEDAAVPSAVTGTTQ